MISRSVILLVAFASLGAAGMSCRDGASVKGNTLTVSIEPLRFIVEEITGDDFRVNVLVPPGSNPETYEPTPLQIRDAEDSRLVFSTGLIGFETVMLERLPSPERFVDLSAGIEVVTSASHAHEDRHNHSGGVDPHIWVSPKTLARMARTAYERIHELYPDSISYTDNYNRLTECLITLDKEVADRIAASSTRSFMIFHPGLTYYARDYGLRQITLERDGKDPSAWQLAELVALARTEKVSKVMYQSEFPRRTVEVAASEIGAEPVEIDILGYDIVEDILRITEIITE